MPAERSAPASAANVSGRPGVDSLYLTLFLVLAIGLDAFRIDFFADDLHFVDMAGRVPFLRLLSGANVLWPWYRPLSRELYFWVAVHSGNWALPVTHALSLLVFAAVLILIWRIGTRLLPVRVVTIAIGLFTVSDVSRFILASPSCFQDLFALFWILVALDAHMAPHPRRAVIAAFLAPFAKETGFLVFPLLLALDSFVLPRRSPLRSWLPYSIAALGAVAIHVMVRLAWPAGDHGSPATLPAGQLGGLATQILGTFVSPPPVRWPGVLAIVRAIASVGLLYLLSKSPSRPSFDARPGAVNRFLLIGVVLGVLPLVMAYGLQLTKVHAYHLFPAAVWVCLFLALLVERGCRFGSVGAVAALLVWNLVVTSYVPPDMTRPDSWASGPMGWKWAVRLSAETRSLGADLQCELASRPESLVVLYEKIPWDSYLQTEDGPATRILLRDPTVRAYFLKSPPARLADGFGRGADSALSSERLQILTFDEKQLHLCKVEWSEDEILLRATNAAVAAKPEVARTLLALRLREDSQLFDRGYVRAAATLQGEGPVAYLEELRRSGVDDTSGARPTQLSQALRALDPGLGTAMEMMLRAPRSADAHAALGDTMAVRDFVPGAALELRIALSLDPSRVEDRWRLAQFMLRLGGAREAVLELDALARDPLSGPLGERARTLAAQVRSRIPSEN